jgi:peroxiredoxin
MPRIVPILGLLLTSLGLGACTAPRQTPVVVGREAPSTSVPLVDGTALRVGAQGDVVVVAFFTTWCPASASMLHALDELRANNPRVMVIALDEGDSPDQVKEFIATKKVQLPVGFDVDGQLAKQMALPTVPSMVVLDRAGIVRHVHAGYHGLGDQREVSVEVAALLDPEPPARDSAREVVAAD